MSDRAPRAPGLILAFASLPDGFTTKYYEPKGRPTVSFRGRDGGEASFCE
jgi:hypothetical protein